LPWLVPVNALRSLPGKAATVTDRTSSKAVAQDLALHEPEDQTSEMARSLRSECGMARISSQTCYYVAILDRNWVFGRTMPSNRNSTNAVICATGRAQRTQAIGRSDELRGSAANPYRSPIIRASGCRSTRPATRSGSPVFGPIFSPPVALPTRPGPKSPGVSLARLDLSDAARDYPSCGVFCDRSSSDGCSRFASGGWGRVCARSRNVVLTQQFPRGSGASRDFRAPRSL
jgi:hypothetical protein